MIPELGQIALILALCLAVLQGVVPLAGAATGIASWMNLAIPAARGQFFFVLLALLCLGYSFVTNDFSVRYVASHSNSALPLMYRIAAVWGGHEGSLLLWTFILSGWTLAVTFFSHSLPRDVVARVLGVMGLVSIGFLLFMSATSNPFDRLLPAAVDGADLNPLLQDPVMAIHPPMLYMGYVGFSVAFAFAIAALLGGRLDASWARWSRPWTISAWAFLGAGIGLGSWWAYYELGWGGWWFWDPVENASFMPWLVGTALVHSLAVTEKRGSFKSWTVLLAIIAFSLSLLGTFLVRSGVLTSVHAFATDPTRGIFILGFLVVVVGGSLLLYAWRAPKIGIGGSFDAVSRETLLLANNVLLVVAMATVLLGTLYPLALDALGLGKISVGPPYFNAVFIPIMAPVVFLMGIGPMARWKQASLPELSVRLRWAFITGIGTAIILPFILGGWTPLIAVGLLLFAWLTVSMALDLKAKLTGPEGWLARLRRLPRGYYGMQLAHLGVAVFILGVTLSGGYGTEEEVSMGRGDSVDLGGYVFRLDGVKDVRGPNYRAKEGQVTVLFDGNVVSELRPQKRRYDVGGRVMTEASIDAGLTRHLYVALGESGANGVWSLRLYHKPFVQCIWLGVLMMSLGGALSASDRRYRLVARRQRAAAREQGAGTQPAAPQVSS